MAGRVLPALALLAPLLLQSPSFRSRADLVAVTVTVLDEKGAPVPGLAREAFAVTEDGRSQAISHFASGNVPISIVVALDASESMRGGRFGAAREVVRGFLDRLGPDDEFTVIGFNDRPFSIAPWTLNREAILAAIGRIEPQGATALYAATTTAIDGLRGSRNRRQTLVIVSDGNDQRDGERAGSAATKLAARRRSLPAIDRVRHSEALVYAIGVDAPDVPAPLRLDAEALRELTDPSGGSTRIVRSNPSIVETAERIGDELRQQYVLGFAPAHADDGKFHKIQVTINGCPRCGVHARSGFIADSAPAR